MSKTLKITATLAVPEGAFDQARVLNNVEPILEQFKASLAALGGTVTEEIASSRPRKAKVEAAAPAPAAEETSETAGEGDKSVSPFHKGGKKSAAA